MKKTPLLLAIGLLAALACDSSSPTTPEEVEEEPVEVETTTESFSGEFGQNETATHYFTVAETGDLEIQLTALGPLETLTVGVGFGTNDGLDPPSCVLLAEDATVRLGETLLSQALTPFDYCVFIRDVGNVFPGVVVTYTLEVTHS